MATVLKITKQDKTVHVVPVTHKAFYTAHNNRLPDDQKWKIEEISEKDAKDLPFIDESHLTPGEALVKSQQLQKVVEDKDAEIEALRAKLAQLNQTIVPPAIPENPNKENKKAPKTEA